jgi:hypothetical protein
MLEHLFDKEHLVYNGAVSQNKKVRLSGEMNICSCGGLFDDESSQCPRCEALQVFGLRKDALETEIRDAYRLFLKVWSPDNLQGDELSKAAAEDKLKDIHAAFEYLTMTSTERAQHKRPVYLTARTDSTATTTDVARVEPRASTGYTTLVVLPPPTPPPSDRWYVSPWKALKQIYRFWRRFWLLFGLAAIVFALTTGKSIRSYFLAQRANWQPAASINTSGVPGVNASGAQDVPIAAELPKNNSQETEKGEAQSLASRNGTPAPAGGLHAASPVPLQAANRQPVNAPPALRTIHSYITIGSTKDEVIALQGTPTETSDDKLVYGKSELDLKDGVVVGWRIDPNASTMRVKLWPSSPVDTEPGYFAVGSTRDFVLAVQGTPTAFTQNKFEYGDSVVYFQNNRVASWKNDPASIPLRVRAY